MFGVLVAEDEEGRLGFTAAFSGLLDGSNAEEKQMNIPQEVKAEDVARIDKYDLQERIYYYSEQLYGYNNGNRLIELTTEEIDVYKRQALETPEHR